MMGDGKSPILFECDSKMKQDLTERIPQHVAIIMDGNGRWAQQKNLSRTQGHAEGIKRVEEIIAAAQLMGVQVLTLFTFSTENWRRPESEVNILMKMLTNVLKEKIKRLKDINVRFQVIGQKEGIPEAVWETLWMATQQTQNNTGLIVNLAFNYGARLEIVDAVKNIAGRVKRGELGVEQIDEATISQALYTRGLPDPDLLIRTSGEMRISNFLLWQVSYAELYFTDKFWPEFDAQELSKAIKDYQSRERRYGKLSEDPRERIA